MACCVASFVKKTNGQNTEIGQKATNGRMLFLAMPI